LLRAASTCGHRMDRDPVRCDRPDYKLHCNRNRTPCSDSIVERLLQTGGCVVLLRHAATEPGVGDPPDFSLSDCRTQRNLSAAGQQPDQTRLLERWGGAIGISIQTRRGHGVAPSNLL
jgi:hypothetical protein